MSKDLREMSILELVKEIEECIIGRPECRYKELLEPIIEELEKRESMGQWVLNDD